MLLYTVPVQLLTPLLVPTLRLQQIESFVDANLPGGLSGTCLFPFCRKSESATENTSEAEMAAANLLRARDNMTKKL